MNDILRRSDLIDDALYLEYVSAVKPPLPPVPIEVFKSKLHRACPTRIIPLDLARQLGVEPGPATGPTVSALGLGCMAMSGMYGPADDEESVATIHAALDAGVNMLDTGDFYGSGHNELLVGRALKQTNNNVTHAARLLKISRKGLQLKMKELGLREGSNEKNE